MCPPKWCSTHLNVQVISQCGVSQYTILPSENYFYFTSFSPLKKKNLYFTCLTAEGSNFISV